MEKSVEISRKPRARKLYGHIIEDVTIKLGGPRYGKRLDRRKLPHRHGMGAPYHVATLLPLNDTPLFLAFHDIIKSLDYTEGMALARALGVRYHTILNWKKCRTIATSAIIVVRVIQWDRAGRPMQKVKHGIDDTKPVFFADKVDALRELEAILQKSAIPVRIPAHSMLGQWLLDKGMAGDP